MRRIAVAVCSFVHSSISRLTGSSRARVRLKLLVALVGLMLPASILLTQRNLKANSNIITVDNFTDPASTSGNGFCTLREAINNANAASDTSSGDCVAGTGTDTILFSVSGTITLGSTLPAIANSSPGSLTIDGTGQTVTVDGASTYRALVIDVGAILTVNDLTIANGNASGADGGGIENSGTLTIANSTLSGNSAPVGGNVGYGGGINSEDAGTLTVNNSTFSDNSAGNSGGAIAAGGKVTISNSTFSGNTASSDFGGAIEAGSTVTIANTVFSNNLAGYGGGAVDCGSATISDSTFSGNAAGTDGGGVNCTNAAISGSTFSGNMARFGGAITDGGDGLVTVTNSTFSGNSGSGADNAGGGIYAEDSTLTVSNSTFSGNLASSGGGVYSNANITTISNTILAGSSGGNCAAVNGGTITNSGNNISDDGTCGFGTSTGGNGKTIGDNVNPLLASDGLSNNGGPTQTIALQATSPAVAAVPLAQCTTTTDQRGNPRPAPRYNACDVGAYEFAGIVVNTLSDSSTSGDGL